MISHRLLQGIISRWTLVIQLLRGEGWILNNRFNRHILVRLPSQGLNVKCHGLSVFREMWLQVAETQKEMLINNDGHNNLSLKID
jgi:hypothetical protein